MREKTTRYQAETLRRVAELRRRRWRAREGRERKAAGVSAENTVHHQQISCLGRVLRECRCDLSESLASFPPSFFSSLLLLLSHPFSSLFLLLVTTGSVCPAPPLSCHRYLHVTVHRREAACSAARNIALNKRRRRPDMLYALDNCGVKAGPCSFNAAVRSSLSSRTVEFRRRTS